MKEKIDLLNQLAKLLSLHRQEIAKINSQCVATAISTNLDNLDRAVSTLKKYASEAPKPAQRQITGISVYSCFNDPSFGVFGLVLAPALLNIAPDAPILIGFPSVLKKYANKINELLAGNPMFRNFEIVVGSSPFMNETLSRKEIELSVVFGDQWVNQFICRFKEQRKSLMFYGPANNAAVILPGTDLEHVIEKIYESAFILNGQAAVCINRVLIDNRLNRKEVMRIFQNKLKEIPFGSNPLDVNNFVTPINLKTIVDEARQKVSELRQMGCIIDGYSEKETDFGTLLSPTLVWDCPQTHSLWTDYHFYPALPIVFVPFDTMAASINQPDYGLYTSIWGNRMEAKQLTGDIDSNQIMVLKDQSILDVFSIEKGYTGPWGGYRQSGFFMGPQTNWQQQGGGFYLNIIANSLKKGE